MKILASSELPFMSWNNIIMFNVWIKILYILCVDFHQIFTVTASTSSSKFISVYGDNMRSGKQTMLSTVTRSKVGCSSACLNLYGCGGYNYMELGNRKVKCELKQGESSATDVIHDTGWDYYQKEDQLVAVITRDCSELQNKGFTTSGVYEFNLDPDGIAPDIISVYCDMDTDGGGWTVLAKRQDGSVDFNQNWSVYQQGFGNIDGEFWMGLDSMHKLSGVTPKTYQVRFDMTAYDDSTAFAVYDGFIITSELDKYRLVLGTYSGTAGDSLTSHNNMQFSTPDNRNDLATYDCASRYQCGFWFNACSSVRLTGIYGESIDDPTIDSTTYYQGILWSSWLGFDAHPKYMDMKIKPI